jgi:hypothetical protein
MQVEREVARFRSLLSNLAGQYDELDARGKAVAAAAASGERRLDALAERVTVEADGAAALHGRVERCLAEARDARRNAAAAAAAAASLDSPVRKVRESVCVLCVCVCVCRCHRTEAKGLAREALVRKGDQTGTSCTGMTRVRGAGWVQVAAAAAERDARIAALEEGLQAASSTHANLLAAVEDARQMDAAAAAAAKAVATADAARSEGARLAAALATLQDRTGTLQQEVHIPSPNLPRVPASDGHTGPSLLRG